MYIVVVYCCCLLLLYIVAIYYYCFVVVCCYIQANSLSEFDAAITAPIFGYKSEVDYYADACLVNKVCNIAIPYIAIVAEDDPFVPKVGK